MNIINTDLYLTQSKTWPSDGRHIMASYDDQNIIVYQAYNPQIAEQILLKKNFHDESCLKAGFSLTRMSWIKTNFLWMMYRSGWATKKNQEKILAIRIKRDGFEEILRKSVLSVHDNSEEAKLSIKNSSVILQWDPDHNPDYSKVETGRRAIQLGLRDEMLLKFSKEFIVDIYDVTQFVSEQYSRIHENFEIGIKTLEIPIEKVYIPIDSNIQKHINLSVSK
ncbi:unnamed protein product [Brachionus calyciflorus]|uniref:DUF4291 domain-containing protein n=1 Tax=Brachionus calyciflorus TaxID=104777 RepID=A0A813QEJ1_9BILA|nr:unnamed protein product [Brachionus calyciflorus]